MYAQIFYYDMKSTTTGRMDNPPDAAAAGGASLICASDIPWVTPWGAYLPLDH